MRHPSDNKCIRCGSFHLIKKGRGFGRMKAYWRQRYECDDCGYKQTGRERHFEFDEEFRYQPKELSPRNWTAYTLAQKNNKLFLMGKLQEMLGNIEIKEEPCIGRPQANLKDICFALSLKSFTRLSSRRLHSDLVEAKEAGLIQDVPKYSTLMKYLATEELTTLLGALIRASNTLLESIEIDCASDSSGFSTNTFSPWYDARVGRQIDKRDFVKGHITIDVKTHVIVSIIVTPWNGADSPQFEPMINEAAERFKIREISADKAYSSRKNLEIAASKGAEVFIPFLSTVTGKQEGSKVWGDSFKFYKKNPQEFGEHYHKRSNVEAAFSMIKKKFSQTLTAKTFQGQKNEILLKTLNHNITCLIHQHFERAIQDPLWNQAYFVEQGLKKV